MSIREGPISDEAPLQFGLRSLFLLMTVVATVSALGHYFGEIVLRCVAIGVFLMIAVAFVTLGPALVTEVLTLIVDKSMVVIGVTKRALHKRLTVDANAAGQHDVAADPGQCSAQGALTSARRVYAAFPSIQPSNAFRDCHGSVRVVRMGESSRTTRRLRERD